MNEIFAIFPFDGEMLVEHFVKENSLHADMGNNGLVEAGIYDNGLIMRMIRAKPNGALALAIRLAPHAPSNSCVNFFAKKTPI